MKFVEFLRERNDAILSMDEEKFHDLVRKYGITEPQEDIVFWAGIHKSILALNAASAEQKEASRTWLTEHGFSGKV